MGEAWGKRGGSVGEAGGSRGILRGSTLFDLGKTQCFGGKQLAPVPLLNFKLGKFSIFPTGLLLVLEFYQRSLCSVCVCLLF